MTSGAAEMGSGALVGVGFVVLEVLGFDDVATFVAFGFDVAFVFGALGTRVALDFVVLVALGATVLVAFGFVVFTILVA